MARTLSAATIAQKSLYATTPINIIKVEWPAPVGTRYYADRALTYPVNAEGRVLSWSSLDLTYQDGRLVSAGRCPLTLRDEDKTLIGYARDHEAQRTRVTLYQHFAGLGESDLVPLLSGVMAAPITWAERAATFTFHIAEIVVYHDKVVGTVATRERFSDLPPENEGRMLPLVFGTVRRVPALLAQGGATTELARAALPTDEELFVVDASDCPQGEAVRILIDREEMLGSFQGNKFVVTQRGASVASGTTTAAGEQYAIVDSNLEQGSYVGAALRVNLACQADSHWTKEYHAIITGHDAAAGKLYYFPALWNPDATQGYVAVPNGKSYTIGTVPDYHEAGASVVEINPDGFIYIANDAASSSVLNIEVWGEHVEDAWVEGARVSSPRRGWVTVPPELYTVNKNDTSSFPGLGHAVTTVTFARPVWALLGAQSSSGPAGARAARTAFRRLRLLERGRSRGDTGYSSPHIDDAICVTLEGVESDGDGTGDLAEAPLHICHTILSDARFMGLGSSYVEDYNNVWSGQEPGTVCSFYLERPVRAVALVQDIAFQAMCSLRWSAGADGCKVRPVRLKNGTPEDPAATLTAAQVELGTIELSQGDQADLVTEVIARFSADGEPRSYAVRDPAAETLWGRRSCEIDLWAYDELKWVQWVAAFYLDRWKHVIDEASVGLFLTGLELEPSDTVALDLPELFQSGQRARVIAVQHEPGAGEPPRMDRIGLRLRLWRWPGCGSNGCQGLEETGCAARCQITCTTTGQAGGTCWSCQTSCQYPAMIACLSGCQLYSTAGGCRSRCMVSCTGSCTSACQMSCQGSSRRSGGDPACESSDTVTGNFGRAYLGRLSNYTDGYGTITEISGEGRVWSNVPLRGAGQAKDDDYVVVVFGKPVDGDEQPSFVILPSRYES